MRILVVRLRQIGDVVFTTPIVAGLRRHFPDASLTYLVEPAAAPVLARNPAVDELIVAPRSRGLASLWAEFALIRRLRGRRFDLVLDLHGGPRASLITWLTGAPTRIGYHVIGRSWMYTTAVPRPRELRARHSVLNQWDLLLPLGVGSPNRERDPVSMPVDPDVAHQLAARTAAAGVDASHRLIVMHVSAGNPFRRWPIPSFAAVAAHLAEDDSAHRIIVTSGPSERHAAKAVIEQARGTLGTRGDQVLDCGELSLPELRALLERAVLYIGGDSGPMHVAATSHVPMVSLYGPTPSARSEPWRSRVWPAEAVEVTHLPCRPCDQRVCAPGDFRCLTRITPQEVVDAARRALQAGRALQVR